MREVTRFPDVLDLVRLYLEARLDGVTVGTRLPSTWPAGGFLELDRTGGGRDRLTEDVRIDLAAWHPRSEVAAERIAGEAVSEVVALAGGDLDGWQVVNTGNPGGVATSLDPRHPGTARAVAMVNLRVRGVVKE